MGTLLKLPLVFLFFCSGTLRGAEGLSPMAEQETARASTGMVTAQRRASLQTGVDKLLCMWIFPGPFISIVQVEVMYKAEVSCFWEKKSRMDKKHTSSSLVHKHSRNYTADRNLAAVRMCCLHPSL